MTQYRMRVPLHGDVFTDEAVASLIGQEPRLLWNGDHRHPLGKATIIDAAQEPGFLLLTIEAQVPSRMLPYADEAFTLARDLAADGDPEHAGSLGFTIGGAIADDEGHRTFTKVRPLMLSPIPAENITRKDRG